MVQGEKSSNVFSLAVGLGIVCIGLGILLNTAFVGQFLANDHKIDSTFANTGVLTLQVSLIAFGLYLFIKRPVVAAGNILLLLGSSLFAILLGALVLQVFYTPPAINSGWRAYCTRLEKNQLGYRGHPLVYSDEDYVILLLGDSHVEAIACAYDYMPERRLEYYLNGKGKKVKVFSLAAGGYGQDQQLLALREFYDKYRANLVLLWQTPDNDVWNNVFPSQLPTNGRPKPTFWLEDGQLRGPTEQIGERLPYSKIRLLALFRGLLLRVYQKDEAWERGLPRPYQPLNRYPGPVNYNWQKRWDENIGNMRLENLATEKSHFSIRLTPRSERMQYGLELTRRLLQEIDQLVRTHNGRFIVFNVSAPPEEPQLDEEVFVLNGKFYRTSERQRQDNLDFINAGFEFFDIGIDLEKWRVGPENGHLNEHATDEAMLKLANVLEQLISNKI
ncbi:MAG: hypothetical protein ACRENG_09975 [bacterium]